MRLAELLDDGGGVYGHKVFQSLLYWNDLMRRIAVAKSPPAPYSQAQQLRFNPCCIGMTL